MLSKKLCVFPTSRAIREYLKDKKSTNQLLDKTITIGDFFSNIISIPENQVFIDNDMRIVLLQEALQNIDISSLGIDKSFTKLFSASEYIFKFFKELSSEFKTIDDIKKIDTYEFYEEHLEVLEEIYKSYKYILLKYNYIDTIFLPLEYKLNENYLKNFQSIEIFFEGYFSGFEFELIEQVSQKVELTIHLTLNKFNEKNKIAFEKLGFDLSLDHHYTLNMSKKIILQDVVILKQDIKHTIYPVPLRLIQIAVIKKSITDMIKSGLTPEDIVVIIPDESFYEYLKLFDQEKYFNFAMGVGIFEHKFYKKIKVLYEYMINEEPKYKEKLIFEEIDQEYVQKLIVPSWNKSLVKEEFFSLYDYFFNYEDDENLKEKLLELKIKLENILFNTHIHNEKITLQDGFKIVLQKLSQITLDDAHSGKITVLGILETRYTSFDGVIVVDFNDDKIPKRSVKDKFLSTAIKTQVELPSPHDRQNLQKYYYERVFSNAKQVVISYVENEENTMSRFINEIFETPNIQRKDFTKILTQKRFIQKDENEIILDIDLSTLQWSASRLKNYLTCKRKFYYSVIVGLKEHHISLEPQNFEVGQVVHKVLEDCYANSQTTISNIKNEIAKYQQKNPYMTFELELWKKRLEKFCSLEEYRYNNGEKFYQKEKIFKSEYKGIQITGRIDRIDEVGLGKYAILDYKTSKNLKIDTNKTYLDSNDFQLEFYYLGLRELDVEFVAYYDLYNAKVLKEIMLQEKIEVLEKHFHDLKTKQVNFEMCKSKTICQLCPYKTMCNR